MQDIASLVDLAVHEIITQSNDEIVGNKGLEWKAPNLEALAGYTSGLVERASVALPNCKQLLKYDLVFVEGKTRVTCLDFHSSSSLACEASPDWAAFICTLLFVKNFHLTLAMYVLRVRSVTESRVVPSLSPKTLKSLKSHLLRHCRCIERVLTPEKNPQ